MSSCGVCDRIALHSDNPYWVCDLPHSVVVIGDHQTYFGYTLLLAKRHVRDLQDMSREEQLSLFAEVMDVAGAVQRAFGGEWFNYASAGNQVPHVHWHVNPQRTDEPMPTEPTQSRRHEFVANRIDAAQARTMAARLRDELAPSSRPGIRRPDG